MTNHSNNGFLSRMLRQSAAPASQRGISPAARGSAGVALHASPHPSPGHDPLAITPAPHTDGASGDDLQNELAWRETIKKFTPQSSPREDSHSQVATEVEQPSDASAYPSAHTSPEIAATRPRDQAKATTNAPTTTVSSRVGPPEMIYEHVFVDDATAQTQAAPPDVTGPSTSSVETRRAPFRPVDASRPGPMRTDITKTINSPVASAPPVAGQARITLAETIPERPSLEDVNDARTSGAWPRRPVSIHFENLEPPAPLAPREPPPPEVVETQTTRRLLLPADAPAADAERERRVEVVTHTAAKSAGPQPSPADTRATSPHATSPGAADTRASVTTPATLTPAARPQEQLQTLSGPLARSSRPRDETPRVTIGRLDIQILERPPAPAEPPPPPLPPPPTTTDFRETLDRRHLGNVGLNL